MAQPSNSTSTYVVKGQIITAPAAAPALYLVATPIGNLADISLRALETLASADIIACEDTRVTGKLLRHYGITGKLIAYHEHNAGRAGPMLISELKDGKSIALVSDAGTPLVSDPGFQLVQNARSQGLDVVPIPGASAVLAALVASGLAGASWKFCGFLPSKQSQRKTELNKHAAETATLVFFESPNRLQNCLEDMVEVFGEKRNACVARELTKLHETIITEQLGNLACRFSDTKVKGEIVILIAPASEDTIQDTNALLRELLETMSVSKAAAEAAQLTGLSKRELYQAALTLKEET